MLAIAAAFVMQSAALPEKAVVSYSGIPTVTGQNVVVQSHTVTVTVAKDHVDVATLTLVKNNGPAGKATVMVPMGHAGESPSDFGMRATWANAPLSLDPARISFHTEARPQATWYIATGAMQNLGTYALRINYSVPIGVCGFDHKQRVAAYDLTSPARIGTLMVTYAYAPGVVFHEPEAGPNIGWQVGLKGAFIKLTDYDGKAGLSYCAFYPAGFGG